MMNKAAGNITKLYPNGRGGVNMYLDDGQGKYAVYSDKDLNGTVGDYVEFNWVANGEYKNTKGKVVKGTAPADAKVTATFKPTGTSTPSKTFPVDAFHPDRSIIRQNSLTHASHVLIARGHIATSCAQYASDVISVARIFESYSAGDMDSEMVAEEVRKMIAEETS